MTWFGLLVFDGSHNPVTARFTPDLVHTPADIDTGGALIVFPALLLFPLGNALLALLRPRRTPAVLIGVGAAVYTSRIRHIRQDHGGVRDHPRGAQQLRLAGLG
jgi:hypothetical protein